MAAQASRKEETNVVGDQKNWEQRVTSELEVAKVWCDNWGSLFEGATTQQQQIASLEEKLQGWVRNFCAIEVSHVSKFTLPFSGIVYDIGCGTLILWPPAVTRRWIDKMRNKVLFRYCLVCRCV